MESPKTALRVLNLNVRAHAATTMNDPVQAPPSLRDSVSEKPHDSPRSTVAETPEPRKTRDSSPSLDLKGLTDRTLQFLATASNETLGACLVGLGAGTYLILGRVGLVLIGVVGGVVLHATWEGRSPDAGHGENTGKSAEARRRELGVDIAHRVLGWRDTRTQEKSQPEDDGSDLSLKLYSGKKLDYSDFKPETAAALTELTDAVIRDYVKYVPKAMSVYPSNALQVVVLTCPPRRGVVPQLVPSDLHCLHALRVCASFSKAPRR